MRGKLRKALFSRLFTFGLLIAVQFVILFLVAYRLRDYLFYYNLIGLVLSVVVVLTIINSKRNMAYKLAWSLFVLIFPYFGAAVYLIFCGNRHTRRSTVRMLAMGEALKEEIEADLDDGSPFAGCDQDTLKQIRYINEASGCPPCRACDTRYFPTGESAYETFCEELEKAERYIFLEYFIVGEGEMWDRIHGILLDKVRAGVDVRLIYDDVGSIQSVDRFFPRRLEKEGIQCRVFHRFIPVLSSRQNNRDHRKICAIDGKTVFTGGINIADEYINRIERFGYWKDNVLMTRGEAVWNFVVMFLTMWDYLNGEDTRDGYDRYRPVGGEPEHEEGIIQPYADNPIDDEPVGENVYLGMLAAANRYVWITTPYLIIDEQMEKALCRAVKSGIDVRIVTPTIPDKKMVNELTKSYYKQLIDNGVRIYEYTPGFIHAKTFLCDDRYAVVGSVNLDYRSLYLHFECGAWMADTACIADVKADFDGIFEVSEEITEVRVSFIRRIFRGILQLIAPLL